MVNYRRKRSTVKKPVNPYLFILAKRLAQYYYFGFENPSDLQFVKAIYNRYKSKKYESTTYVDASTRKIKNEDIITIEKVKLDPNAKGIARRIHKILKTQDLCFTNKMLDHLVIEINTGREGQSGFATWSKFVDQFKDDRGAVDADNLCKHKNISDFSSIEKKAIQDAVEYKCLKLLSRDQKFGYNSQQFTRISEKECDVIANSDSYTIRTAYTSTEVRSAVLLRDESVQCLKLQRVEFMSNLWRINRRLIFLYLDEHGVGGYISLIPVIDQWFDELLSGEKFKKPILKSDILGLDETHLIKNIFIESIDAVTPRIGALLRFYLPLMLEQIMEGNVHDFSLFYIAGEEDNQMRIKNYEFTDFTTLYGETMREIKTLYLAKGRELINIIGQ